MNLVKIRLLLSGKILKKHAFLRKNHQYPSIRCTPVRSSGGNSANWGGSSLCPRAAYWPVRVADFCGFAPCRKANSVSSETMTCPLTLLDGSFPLLQYRYAVFRETFRTSATSSRSRSVTLLFGRYAIYGDLIFSTHVCEMGGIPHSGGPSCSGGVCAILRRPPSYAFRAKAKQTQISMAKEACPQL